MLGNLAKLGSQPDGARGVTSALRRIQMFFWVTTVAIVSLFAGIVTWMSYDHLSQFTSEALSYERGITCNIVRYHVERYLTDHVYTDLLPGKTDTGLNQILSDLVEHNPTIINIRVVNQELYHVATAGDVPEGLLGPDHRDRCCSVLPAGPSRLGEPRISSGDSIPGSGDRTSTSVPTGRFHDPNRLAVYCVEAPLYVDGQLVGRVAIHEDNPLSTAAYQQARSANTMLIFAASALLLAALAISITWTSREMRGIEERIAQSDRNASLADLAAGVAHEIRNPLNTISLSCTFLLRKVGEDQGARESLEMISGEVTRLQETINSFLQFARTPRLELARVDIDEIIDSTLEVLDAEIRDRGIEVHRHRARGAHVRGDVRRLREVFVNFVRNAIQAIQARGGGGAIEVSTRQTRRHVIVEIADDGVGIPDDVRRRLFEPYFTTKIEGLGLGLTQALQTVRAHGGRVDLDETRAAGATFIVKLPTRGPRAGRATAPLEIEPLGSG